MNRPELLAPAGSMESLRAAVDNGADAVYLGVGAFNARINAQNFTVEELPEAVGYAHLHSVLVYLTLNTLIHDSEIEDALQLAVQAYETGVDAIIVQDIGLTRLLCSKYPNIPLHASTQMNLFSHESIQWAKEHHLKRIVLPRELSADEIRSRTAEAAEAGLEIEVFIHGALCVSYSGLCLFSAMNGNGARSGNRGLCAQPCRTRFKLLTSAGSESLPARLLSPKDQSGADFLRELIRAGVHSFKIEGRMKDASYVAVTVRAYRELIDSILAGEDAEFAEEQLKNHMLLAFNRGGSFTSQYLQGDKKGDLLSGEYSGRYGVLLGVVIKRNPRLGTLTLRHSNAAIPVRGDYLSIRMKEAEIASFPIGSIEVMGDVLQVKGLHPQVIEKVPDGASVYQMSELSYTKDLLSGKSAQKTAIRMQLVRNKKNAEYLDLILTVTEGIWQNMQTTYSVQALPNETSPELSVSRISEQLMKSKSSPFSITFLEVQPDISLCVPVSAINDIRRQGFMSLEQLILDTKHSLTKEIPAAANHPVLSGLIPDEQNSGVTPGPLHDIIHVNYFDLNRLSAGSLSVGADYYSFSVFQCLTESGMQTITSILQDEPDAKVLLWLPGAYKDNVAKIVHQAVKAMKTACGDSFAGMVSTNLQAGAGTLWISGFANLYNTESVIEAFSMHPFAFAPSYELKDREIEQILEKLKTSKDVRSTYISLHRYGRIEWMQSEFCPVGKHALGCRKCNEDSLFFSLRTQNPEDEDSLKGKTLPVITHSGPCTADILGPLHASVSDELLQTCRNIGFPISHTLRFLDESPEDRRQIVQNIRSSISV